MWLSTISFISHDNTNENKRTRHIDAVAEFKEEYSIEFFASGNPNL